MSGNEDRDWLTEECTTGADVDTVAYDTGERFTDINYAIISGALERFFGTEVAADSESITAALAARNGDLGTAVQHLLDHVPGDLDVELAQVLPIRTYGLGEQLGGQYLGRLEEIQQLTPEPYDTSTGADYL